MTKEEQLEKSAIIAEKWMGCSLQWLPRGSEYKHWVTKQGEDIGDVWWNPFANPADCAMVMEKTIELGKEWVVYSHNHARIWIHDSIRYWDGYGDSWLESLCNAVLEVLEGDSSHD